MVTVKLNLFQGAFETGEARCYHKKITLPSLQTETMVLYLQYFNFHQKKPLLYVSAWRCLMHVPF